MDTIQAKVCSSQQQQPSPHHPSYCPSPGNGMRSPDSQGGSVAAMPVSGAPTTEAIMPASASWAAPPTSQPRRNSGGIYQEGFSCCSGDECTSMPGWDSMSLHTGTDGASSRPVSMHQEMLPLGMANSLWPQKACEENLDFHGLEVDGPIGQAYTTDEAVPIIDLRFSNPAQDGQPLSIDTSLGRRSMSGSSPTTSGAMSDLPSYDDFSTALSEAPSYGSDYPSTSNRNSYVSSSMNMSPIPSPHSRPEQVRAHSRGRASPSPRPSMRSVPYSVDGPKGGQRWSTGSCAPGQGQGQRQSPVVYSGSPDPYGVPPQHLSYQGPPPAPYPPQQNMGVTGFPPAVRPPYMMSGQPMYHHRPGMLLPLQMNGQQFHPDGRPMEHAHPLPAQGFFKMLQSNGDAHALQGHYTALSDPPDLFTQLQEEQVPPPDEDMNPSDPDMIPYEQDLRFEGDLYTPRWVRGHGNKREGWCGICKPGRWLVLKNSAFWYDKSFTHGISAATGSPFQEPLDIRRMDGNPDIWEGLCGSCNDWIALVSSKKKGTTWFRHAYKCHSHPKAKDTPKRRREAAQGRGPAAQQAFRGKQDAQSPATPQTGGAAVERLNAPTSAPMVSQTYGQGGDTACHPPVLAPEPVHLPPARMTNPTAGLANMI